MKLRQGLLRFIAPKASKEERLEAALEPGGMAEGGSPLPPEEQLTVLFVLSFDKDGEVAEAARRGFRGFPLHATIQALSSRLDPLVLREVCKAHRENAAILTLVAMNPGADPQLLSTLARTGPAEVVTLLAEDRDRLVNTPGLLDAVMENPSTPARLVASLQEGLAASTEEGAGGGEADEADEAPEGAEEAGEIEDEEAESLYKRVQTMVVADKVKLALTGDKTARDILMKDANKVVSSAVLKNPRITEEEVVRIATSKTTSDDLLRQIALRKEWMKNYNIKLGMVMNAKTPLPLSLRLLDHLNTRDLAKVSKSRDIPGTVATNAIRKLEMRKKRGG